MFLTLKPQSVFDRFNENDIPVCNKKYRSFVTSV